MCYISIHLRKGKSFKHFHTNWNSKNANFTIGGFLASLPLSPLILCLLIQDIPNNLEIINALDIQPTDFLVFIKNHRHNHNNNHRYQQPTTKNLAKPSNPLPPRNTTESKSTIKTSITDTTHNQNPLAPRPTKSDP